MRIVYPRIIVMEWYFTHSTTLSERMKNERKTHKNLKNIKNIKESSFRSIEPNIHNMGV